MKFLLCLLPIVFAANEDQVSPFADLPYQLRRQDTDSASNEFNHVSNDAGQIHGPPHAQFFVPENKNKLPTPLFKMNEDGFKYAPKMENDVFAQDSGEIFGPPHARVFVPRKLGRPPTPLFDTKGTWSTASSDGEEILKSDRREQLITNQRKSSKYVGRGSMAKRVLEKNGNDKTIALKRAAYLKNKNKIPKRKVPVGASRFQKATEMDNQGMASNKRLMNTGADGQQK